MARKQKTPLVPPILDDKKSLSDYSSIIQRNFEDLFNDDHTHNLKTTVPSSTDGSPQDIIIVNLSGTYYLYVKVSTTLWKRIALS